MIFKTMQLDINDTWTLLIDHKILKTTLKDDLAERIGQNGYLQHKNHFCYPYYIKVTDWTEIITTTNKIYQNGTKWLKGVNKHSWHLE